MSSTVSWDAMCRLCLSSHSRLLPIFGREESDALACKIRDCVAVQVKEDDQLPTSLCSKCLGNVNNWCQFKKICEKSQKKLETLSKEKIENLINIKSEPLSDETYDDGVVIDGAYLEYDQNNIGKIQPEGPPILASLGLAPRNDKNANIEKDNEEEEEDDDEDYEEGVGRLLSAPEVSVTVMRPSGETLQARQNIQQLASKNCLVCGRSYRYSHNARRHELAAHYFDRYTNKINKPKQPKQPKLRPNPFNPKARLMPNPNNPKFLFAPKSMAPKILNIPIESKHNSKNNGPYPLRIKALTDLQIQKKKEPQILKSLLTARAKAAAREAEIINSAPESPETLISEPEIASFQVEAILSEPDAYDHENEEDGEHEERESHGNYDATDLELQHNMENGVLNDSSNHSLNEVMHHENDVNDAEENYDDGYDEEVLPHVSTKDKAETENTKAIIENGIDHAQEQEDKDEGENGEVGEEHKDDEEMPPIMPIVEINEEPHTVKAPADILSDDVAQEEDDEDVDNEITDDKSLLQPVVQTVPSKTGLTEAQIAFIEQYRDIIEQINTKTCKCCNKDYPRRKAVIQHLQKVGHTVPKHTCYNCVVTFGHIGALLRHMRANVCTDLWRVIYDEDAPKESESSAAVLNASLNKVQYKDILNARSYACKLCPAKFQLKQFIMKHVLDVHEDGQSRVPLACVHCGYRFKENRLWKKHIRNGECTVNIACDLCPERFQSIIEFNDHAVAAHAGGFDADGQTKQVDSRPTDCPVCAKSHPNYHNLVKHIKSAHDEERPHFCTHCDSKFENLSDLDRHIYAEHSERPARPNLDIVKEEAEEYHYSCAECNSIFETVDAWTDHQVAEHDQIAHNCDRCEKKFLRPSELAEHRATHLRVKYYSCNMCSNSYGSPDKLAEHVRRTHTGAVTELPENPENQFYCDLCVRGFRSRQAFSNHMRIHAKVPTTNRRPGDPPKPLTPKLAPTPATYVNFKTDRNVAQAPYSCDICGKGFMHKKNIWKHKKVLHADIVGTERGDLEENTMQASTEGEEDYRAEDRLSIPQFDSFNFTEFPMQQSIATANPFSCDICGEQFPIRNALVKHKCQDHGVIDTGEAGGGRSSCTICRINFADKKSYYRHRKNVHKSSVLMCKICGKPLNSKDELYEHLRAAHSRELLGYNARVPSTREVPPANEDTGDYHARYPCDLCGKQFVGMLALQNHQCLQETESAESSTYDCEICHKSYTSISALKSHRGWHLRSPDGKAAANNSGLWMPHHKVSTKHSKHEVLETVRNARPALPFPKRRLPSDVEINIVNSNKRARSDDAVSEADVLSHLARRSQPAEPDERYCAICDKEFTKKAAYQRHMDEVHRPNSIFCPVCDKSFTRKSTLLIHMRKHYEGDEGAAGEEPIAGTSDGSVEAYSCDLCGVHCRSLQALRAHRARHHGEPDAQSDDEEPPPPPPLGEFTCAQCGDGVATPRDLIAHRTMHATPSKFSCSVCKVYFPTAHELSTHTRARHSDNEKVFFPCAMCDRFYMNKKSLQRHIDASH